MAQIMKQSPAIQAMKKRAREQGIPIYGAFELTGRCNLDCKMCYVHVMDGKSAMQQELSTTQWKAIMDDAYDAGMVFALLTGGECLIRPDFQELYLYLYSKGTVMSINTNAVLLNEENVKFLAAHKPEWLQISLYGSNNDSYEKVTGRREYDRVIKAISLLREYKINFWIAVTPSRYMMDDYGNIITYLRENKIPYRVGNELIPPREDAAHNDYTLTAADAVRLAKIHCEAEGRTVEARTLAEAPKPCGSCDKEQLGMPCNAGTIRFVIDWKGKMHPCMSIPEIEADIHENGFMAAWQYIHNTMKKVRQPIECVGCVYEKKCPSCPAVRYNGLFSGHCNKNLCSLAVDKYAAGVLRLTQG